MDNLTDFQDLQGHLLLQKYLQVMKPVLEKGDVYILGYESLKNAMSSLENNDFQHAIFMKTNQSHPYMLQIFNSESRSDLTFGSDLDFVKNYKNINNGTLILLAIQFEESKTSVGSSIFV
jgi:hypothetical protein